MDPSGWRRLLGRVSIAAGAIMVVAIGLHAATITGTALQTRGALDERWAVLQLIGLLAAAAGGVILVTGIQALRRTIDTRALAGFMQASATSALFLLLLLSVTGVLGPVGPVAYAGYLAVLAVAARRMGIWMGQKGPA